MTELPERAARAFDGHDAYEVGTRARLTTTAFEAHVVASETTDEWALQYTVEVRAPSLAAAAAEEVGPTLRETWLETFELRLEDAPGAVRRSVELDDLVVEEVGEDAVARLVFTLGNADRAPAVAKALAEYVEGTYMEGIVPGFTYTGVVGDLLASARQSSGDGGSGDPMPL